MRRREPVEGQHPLTPAGQFSGRVAPHRAQPGDDDIGCTIGHLQCPASQPLVCPGDPFMRLSFAL